MHANFNQVLLTGQSSASAVALDTPAGASISEFQNRRLRQLVQHAYARVPYYRERRDELGATPESFKGVEDLGEIPIGAKTAFTEQQHRALLADSYTQQNLILHQLSQALELDSVGPNS